MALAKTDDTYYKNIAAAIRENLAGSGSEGEQYAPSEMSEGVQAVADYNLVKGYNAGLEAVPKEDCDCFTEEQFNAVVGAAIEVSVPRMPLIDQANWEENNVPQWWIDTEITSAEFSRLTGGKYSFTKTKGSGYAYDFGRQYNRFYMEKSGNGWNGSGGGQYGKYVLTADSTPVPDPDFKDWEIVRDDNGNLISMTPKSFNSSVPQKLPNGHIEVPSTAEAYDNDPNRRSYAMSYGCYEDKTVKLKNELSNKSANAIYNSQEGELLVIDDANIDAYSMTVTGTPGSKIYISGKNCVPEIDKTVTGTGEYYSEGFSIHPIKNRKYIFSADYENYTPYVLVGIAIKPDGSSKTWWQQVNSKPNEVNGTLRLEVEVGDYNSNVALKFYSNAGAGTKQSSCRFSNIVFRLADMDVEVGTEGYTEQAYTLDENGEVVIKAPKYSPALIYNVDGAEISATYSKDISKHFATLEQIGDIEAALDELHAYAQAIAGGENG